MRKEYHKLVRDRIPEIIQDNGGQYEVTILTEVDYEKALRTKLVEEANEVVEASTRHDMITELADIQEVVQALMKVYVISPEALQQEQERRRKDRGSFDKRLYLLWSE